MKINGHYSLFVEIGELFAMDELCIAWNPLYFELNILLLLTVRLWCWTEQNSVFCGLP